MEETLCRRFFLQPDQTLHRRYEVLRAFFVEQRPFEEIAKRFGYSAGTVRNLVCTFRTDVERGQVPPFS